MSISIHWFHQLLLELAPALLEATICGFRKIDLNTICVNTVFVTGLLTYGIVYVASANTTNVFKNRLDKFCHDQEIIYDFNAQLEGTGSRSAVE